MCYICVMNSELSFSFSKYQGTGNDFVLIDNRELFFPKNDHDLINHICDRRFGVGADGLILLENDELSDFKMVYFNSDGKESTMCGNGGRCIVAFAKELGLIQKRTQFNAIDGLHNASIHEELVSIGMINVSEINEIRNHSYLNTGSPHHVQMVENLEGLDVKSEGAKIRYGLYGKVGCNINFVEQQESDVFKVRTYERGVEDETLSCGTGVTAVALSMFHSGITTSKSVRIQTSGGELKVEFNKEEDTFSNIILTGPATKVFKGQW